MKTYRFILSGVVQGVGFRDFVKKRAKELLINGYAKNLDDGTLEVVVNIEGNRREVVMEFLQQGPELAKVEDIQGEIIESKEFKDFQIKY